MDNVDDIGLSTQGCRSTSMYIDMCGFINMTFRPHSVKPI